MKKVTFIISLLNRNTKIQDFITCLDSIRSQKDVESEILVFTSFDGPIALEGELKEAFDRNQVIHKNRPHQTFGALRNLGLEKATGDYVCFINPSDFVVKDSISALIGRDEALMSDIVIGHSMAHNEKNKTLTVKKEYKDLNQFPLELTTEKGMINPDLLRNMNLSNKLFRLEFLKENNIQFSDTEYYNQFLFQITAFVQAQHVKQSPVHFHNERIYSGLDKLAYPTMEEEVNEQQVQDWAIVFEDIYRWNEGFGIDSIYQMVVNNYIKFIFCRGLNYLNISKTPEVVFEALSKPLKTIDVASLKQNNRKKTILDFIQANQFEEYLKFIKEEKVAKAKKRSLKKHVTGTIFNRLYRWSSKLPVADKRVLFISHSPGMDGNYAYIQEAIKEHNAKVGRRDRFTCQTTSTKISAFNKLFLPLKLARAEFILVSEYVPFFQLLDFREETKVVQTWHAAGAFKKFGYSTNYLAGGPNPFKNQKMHLHRGYDYATVSSEDVRKHYANAFDMDLEKVIPVGLPRADFFFNQEAVASTKEKLYGLYPMLKYKKVILYAPTFRGFGKKRANFEMEFDCNQIAKEISDDYIIALKLHPSVKSSDIKIDESVAHKVVDISAYADANDVLTITDLLITDYSSIIFDYSLLNKPMMFYAYDLDEYRYDRDFYYEYEEFVPGPIAKTNEEIIELINRWEFDLETVKQFSETFFVSQDGTNSERFVNEVLVKLSK